MTTYIALLRAVNLGAHNRVAMAELRALLSALGMRDPRSLLASGNLVFRADPAPTARLEHLLEEAAGERLGLATDFFVRTADEWRDVVAGNPFPEEAGRDPGRLVVMTLKEAPGAAAVAALRDAIRGREYFQLRGRHAWVVYPDGTGRSRLTGSLIDRKLGTPGTGRNWNTVLKLADLAGAI